MLLTSPGDGLLSAADLGRMFAAERVCKESAVSAVTDEIIDVSDPLARIPHLILD